MGPICVVCGIAHGRMGRLLSGSVVDEPDFKGIATIIKIDSNSGLAVTSFGNPHSRSVRLYYTNGSGKICELVWNPNPQGLANWEAGSSELPCTNHSERIAAVSSTSGHLWLFYQDEYWRTYEYTIGPTGWAKGRPF